MCEPLVFTLSFCSPGHRGVAVMPSQMNAMGDGLQANISSSDPVSVSAPPSQEREDSIDSSTLLVGPDTPDDGRAPTGMPADCASSLSTVV